MKLEKEITAVMLAAIRSQRTLKRMIDDFESMMDNPTAMVNRKEYISQIDMTKKLFIDCQKHCQVLEKLLKK